MTQPARTNTSAARSRYAGPSTQTRRNQMPDNVRKPSPFDALNRLAQVEAEIERMEAEAQNLRDQLRRYLEDLPEPVLADEINGLEARLVTISRRTIDAKKIPGDLLSHLAERDLVSVKVAAAPVVPPDAVTVTTLQQLRIKRPS